MDIIAWFPVLGWQKWKLICFMAQGVVLSEMLFCLAWLYRVIIRVTISFLTVLVIFLWKQVVSTYRTVGHSVFLFCCCCCLFYESCDVKNWRLLCVKYWDEHFMKHSNQPFCYQQPCHDQNDRDQVVLFFLFVWYENKWKFLIPISIFFFFFCPDATWSADYITA